MLSKRCFNRLHPSADSPEYDLFNFGENVNEDSEKMIDWFLGLRKAIFIADATTEVDFNY